MIEPLHPGYTRTTTQQTASLQSLVNQLLRHSLSELMRESDSAVVVEIPPDLHLKADPNRIVPVIKELLSTIIANARKGRIHIRAERFRDIVIMEVEDLSNYNGYALDSSIKAIEPLARIAGGYLTIRGKQKLDTTVTFSFPNLVSDQGYDC